MYGKLYCETKILATGSYSCDEYESMCDIESGQK